MDMQKFAGGGIPQIMTILYTVISDSHILNSVQSEKNIVIKHAQWIGNLTLDSLFTADRYMLWRY